MQRRHERREEEIVAAGRVEHSQYLSTLGGHWESRCRKRQWDNVVRCLQRVSARQQAQIVIEHLKVVVQESIFSTGVRKLLS